MSDSNALQVVLEELNALEKSVLILENEIAVLQVEIASIQTNIAAIKYNIAEMKQTVCRMLKNAVWNSSATTKTSISIAFHLTKNIRIEFPLPISLNRS